MLTQRSKKFSLFDGINAEVGFHIQVNIQHIFGVTRFFANHFDNFFGYADFVQRDRRSGHRRGRYRRLGYRRLRHRSGHRGRGFGIVGVNRVHFINKRLGAFHYQGGFYAVAVVVFNAQGVLHNFQHRGFLAGNIFQPSRVFGFVGDTGFALLPHFFK